MRVWKNVKEKIVTLTYHTLIRVSSSWSKHRCCNFKVRYGGSRRKRPKIDGKWSANENASEKRKTSCEDMGNDLRRHLGISAVEVDMANDSSVGDSKSETNIETMRELREMFDVAGDNGFLLCDAYSIPEELLAIILSYVPSKELVFNCRTVCKAWCNVIDGLVWRIKLMRINVPVNKTIQLPWFACFWLETKRPLGRNLMKNNCGQEGLKHWKILKSGGDGWAVEKPPVGCEPFPIDDGLPSDYSDEIMSNNSCFVTSYEISEKAQIIDLSREGLCPELMDAIQPAVCVREWCSGRFDCSSVYTLRISLLDWKKKRLKFLSIERKLSGETRNHWQMVSETINDYGPGVRYIEFSHTGKDLSFWKGHYGSKMTGSRVTIAL